jgi:acetone carboxylase gamma subunit
MSDRVRVHEYIALDRAAEPPALLCADCGWRLCDWAENYRLHAVVVDTATSALGGLFRGLEESLDEQIVLRAYHCPSCGRRLDAEVCPESAEPMWDLKLAGPGVAGPTAAGLS